MGTLALGVKRTQLFYLLFAAVAWLRVPADLSPSLREAQELALDQPPGRRFPLLSLAAHALGAVLNLAGISLLVGIIRDAPSEDQRRRATRAIALGLGAAACWTPFFVAMSVGLSLVPGFRWLDVAPLGLISAAVVTGLGWGMDRCLRRRCGADPRDTRPPSPGRRFRWRMAAVPVTLFAAIILLVEARAMPIPVALGLVAPVYATLWMAVLTHGRAPARAAAADLGRRVVGGLPLLRGEVLLFLSANLFGAGVAAALRPESILAALAALSLPVDILILSLLMAVPAMAALGIHPIVPILVIGGVFPPAALGIAPTVFCAALVAMWGIGVTISPLSGLVLFLRRAGNLSGWRVAWLWNGPQGFVGALAVAGLVVLTRHLGLA